METVRYWPNWLWVQLTKASSLTSWQPRFEKRQNWILKIGPEFITHISLLLSERALHEGQNHLFPNDKISEIRNWEVCMPVDICGDSISRFSSETEEHRQVLQDTVVLNVLEIKLLAANDTPLSSSKSTCSISATSCWELKSKGVTLVLDKLHRNKLEN